MSTEMVDVRRLKLVKKKLESNDTTSQALAPVVDTSLVAAHGHDPLSVYLREISRIPLLTIDEERQLALKLFNEQDLESAKKLVSANLRLVVKIALEYRQTYQNVLDLIQEGNIGLMKGVSKYDPNKGVKISTYVGFWIRSYILKFLIDNFRMVKISTTKAQKKLFYNLLRERDRLESQGISPSPKLIADRLHVGEDEVRDMEVRLLGGDDIGFDAPISGDRRSQNFSETLVDSDASTPEVLSETKDLHDRLKKSLPKVLPQLNAREKWILENRIMAEEPKTLQEIADEFKVSRERARQIETEIINKIRVVFESE